MAKGTPNGGINGTLANGLLAHWCFTDGSLADISGNNVNLSDFNGLYETDKDGNSNNAIRFTNSVQKAEFLNYNYLNSSFSYSCFVKLESYSSDFSGFISCGQAEYGKARILGAKSNGNLYFVGWMGTGNDFESTYKLELNTWYCVACKYDGTKVELFVNGVSVGSKNMTLVSYALTNSYIGNSIYLDLQAKSQLVGTIDEIRIYNRALTSNEIAEINMLGVNYEVDVTPPTFNTINTSNTTSSSVNLNINCNEDATAYYKLYNKNATAPTPAELKTTHDGIIALTANNLITKSITGLTALKDYDLYVVAKDTSGNLQALPTKIDFTTSIDLDITPPTFNTINTSNITSSSVNLNINCNEDATAYYKLYDKNETAPTPAELKTTHDGEIALTANNLVTENITGLTALKDYDLYIVAEDIYGNLQTAPTKIHNITSIDFKTLPYIDINEKKEVNLYNEKYVISTRPIRDIIVADHLGNNIKSLDFFSFSNSYLTGIYIYKIKENLKNINFKNIYFLQKYSEVPFCSLSFYDFKTIIINSSETNYSGDEAIKISKILETLLEEVLCFNCNYETEERFEKIIKNCPTDLILKIKGENFFNIVNFKLYLNNFLKIISRRSDNIFVENIKKEFFIFKDDIEFDVFCFNCKNKDEISETLKEQSFLYLNKIKKFIEEEMQQLSCVEFKGEM